VSSKQTDKELKRFGFIFGIVMPVLIYIKWGRMHPAAAFAAAVLFIYCVTSALLKPAALRPLHLILSTIFNLLQRAFTFTALVFCYYLVFTPFGLFFRLLGKDNLDIKMDRNAKTYWKNRPQAYFPPEHYKNQY